MYQTGLPTEQVALKVEFLPEQIADGLALTPAGESGVALTVTVCVEAGLLQPLLLQMTA